MPWHRLTGLKALNMKMRKTEITPKTSKPTAKPAPVKAAPAQPLMVAKPAPAAPVAKPAPAPAAPPVAMAKGEAKPAPATIEVKMDVGFGNALFLRGEGGGLTWEHGIPLVCINSNTWHWSHEIKEQVKFKLLINDQVWSAGGDLVLAPGKKVEVVPTF